MHMNINEYPAIPQDWCDALATIQTHFPEAVIAGGALRDHLTGRPVKDVDVFISSSHMTQNEVACVLAFLFQREVIVIIGEGAADYVACLSEISFTLETTTALGMPLQIIAMTGEITLDRMVERIDFGICRVGFDGKTLFRHTDFFLDAMAHQFTLRTNTDPARYPRSVARYERLQAKFPGWPMVVPA